MRRGSAILLLSVLALVAAACGGDDEGATTAPGGSSTTTAPTVEPADVVWYTDWDAGAAARWNLGSESCDGVTAVGLSADLIEVGLGWVWVTDCQGGQLVRLDIQTGEVTGRIPLDACPSAMVITEGLVWLALPSLSKVVAVHPETGEVVAEGTSELDTPIYLAAGSLHAAGQTYYWRVDEVAPNVPGGSNWAGDVWSFSLDPYVVTGDFGGPVQGLAVGVTGGNDVVVLVGPPKDSSFDYSDPNYPTQLVTVDQQGNQMPYGPPLMGFYNYLAVVDGHYVATSKVSPYGVVANAAQVKVPLAVPGKPLQGPPPPGGGGGDGEESTTTTTTVPASGPGAPPWVWIPQRGPGNIVVFPVNDPPENPVPAVEPQCSLDGTRLDLWYLAVLSGGGVTAQAALAEQMDRTLFPVGPVPEEPVTPTTPSGPRFSSCSVGYESSGRLLTGMEGTTEPGATVVLNIEYGTQLYADVATVTAGDDGTFAFPEMSVDDLGPPAPVAGATITVVYTADDNYPGSCRLDVDT